MRDRIFFFTVVLAAALVLTGMMFQATARVLKHVRLELER